VKLVLTLVVRDEADIVDAQIAYHLNAGVDFVIASDHQSQDGTTEILESYARDGYLLRIPVQGEVRESAWRTHMARLAVAEHGADWVISSDADEFWWPRGESLKDVLAVIPERYAVVQALVRDFAARAGDGAFFADRRTARTSLLVSHGEVREPLARALRHVYRAEPEMVIEPGDPTHGGRRVPLRAWYPIEVFYFPARTPDAPGVVDAARLDGLIADGSLVVDTRLRDALRSLRDAAGDGSTRRFELPADGESRLSFPVPSIVDDASYAVECAAVGEVDLVRLDQHIRELEQRISLLEARFWPRVVRRLARLGRRRR